MMAVRLSVLCVILLMCPVVFSGTLLDLIKSKTNLKKMAAIIEADELARMQFRRTSYTAFMPTDDAMEKFDGPLDLEFIHAHLTNTPLLIQDIGDTITTVMTGNPDLYVTKLDNGQRRITDWEDVDYYINNAKVVLANQKAKTEEGADQMLHTVDQVLPPTRPLNAARPPVQGYPTAADVLLYHRSYGLVDENSIRVFKDRVEELGVMDVFRTEGENTFFIAVDRAIKSPQVLDEQVIHGHVITGQTLFTRPAARVGEEIKSLAFTDNLKVLLKVVNVSSAPAPEAYYVTSNTVASDNRHTKGTAMARIVRTNIPVANGVMHLIDRPLMTTASSIMSYLQEEGGQLSEFYRLFGEHQQPLLNRLAALSDSQAVTLFAPSNYAFSMVKKERLDEVALNPSKLADLLKLHIVPRRLTTDEIIKGSENEMFQIPTLRQGRNLYFAVNHNDLTKLPIVSVEGGGVNATITTPNIVAENGVIHIINRIMDVPSQTIYEKLQSNPSISLTFNLSSQGNFNEQFKSREEKFTLFVPNNEAWAKIRKEMVTPYKKLFMGDFEYHARPILERHLIVGRELSIKALTALTNNGSMSHASAEDRETIQMTRGKIHFEPRVTMNVNEYYLRWSGIEARVVQSDVECVNGVVHIIDRVLMIRDDMTVAAAPPTAVTTVLASVAMMLLTAVLR